MKAAILNPGPSLNTTYKGRHGYDVVIGVNRTMLAHDLDWWVWMDTNPPMPRRVWEAPDDEWKREKPATAPHQFTTGTGAEYLESQDLPRDGNVWRFNDYQDYIPNRLKWHVFSATAAISLAFLLGATSADVYGADMRGESDFDGSRDTRDNRDEKRWLREAGIWNETIAWLSFNGMAVRRIVPQGLYHAPRPERRTHGIA